MAKNCDTCKIPIELAFDKYKRDDGKDGWKIYFWSDMHQKAIPHIKHFEKQDDLVKYEAEYANGTLELPPQYKLAGNDMTSRFKQKAGTGVKKEREKQTFWTEQNQKREEYWNKKDEYWKEKDRIINERHEQYVQWQKQMLEYQKNIYERNTQIRDRLDKIIQLMEIAMLSIEVKKP